MLGSWRTAELLQLALRASQSPEQPQSHLLRAWGVWCGCAHKASCAIASPTRRALQQADALRAGQAATEALRQQLVEQEKRCDVALELLGA